MNMVAIYRVCEHSCNIECANRVAVCEQGGNVRTGWQCANRVAAGWQCANRVAVCEQGGSVRTGWQCANRVAVCEQGGNI